MKWTASQTFLPLQLSPQGVMTSFAEHVLKENCHAQTEKCCFNELVGRDFQKSVSYYNPAFYCTSRAICIGPGDTVLCIFPQDQVAKNFVPSENQTDKLLTPIWTLQLTFSGKHPAVFHRFTPLESVLTHANICNYPVLVSEIVMHEIRQKHKELITPPVPNVLRPNETFHQHQHYHCRFCQQSAVKPCQ